MLCLLIFLASRRDFRAVGPTASAVHRAAVFVRHPAVAGVGLVAGTGARLDPAAPLHGRHHEGIDAGRSPAEYASRRRHRSYDAHPVPDEPPARHALRARRHRLSGEKLARKKSAVRSVCCVHHARPYV